MSNKYLRDKNFWRYQNQVILSLMGDIEEQTGTMFHETRPELDREIQVYLDDQTHYKARSRIITHLEKIRQK